MKASTCAEMRVGVADAEARVLEMRKENPKLVIQLVSMEELPRAKAVEMIAAQTIRAMETESMLASRPEVDLLLRLAGTRQISVAMERCGYKAPGRKLLVALGPERQLEEFREKIARHKDFAEVQGKEIDGKGLWMVEAAALLASRN